MELPLGSRLEKKNRNTYEEELERNVKAWDKLHKNIYISFYISVICQTVGELTSRDIHVLYKITLNAERMCDVSEMPALKWVLGAAGGCNLRCMRREMNYNSSDAMVGPWEPACLTPFSVTIQTLLSGSTLSPQCHLICTSFSNRVKDFSSTPLSCKQQLCHSRNIHLSGW